MAERGIEYRRVRDLVGNPRNPKAHDLELIDASVGRFGYVEPIVVDGRTGKIISGHGRMETLSAMELRGDDPPDGVMVEEMGGWAVPVVVGWASRSDREAEAALVALNRAGEVGGWEDAALVELLSDLAAIEDGLVGVGYDEADIATLLASLEEPEDTAGDGGTIYTTRHSALIYEVTGERPDPAELVDRAKVSDLVDKIRAADLPDDVEAFLLAAATRHYRFRYDRIAEFYAHADAPLQRLMEESALVIIDFDDAIANGFVRLSSRLAKLLDLELAERGIERDVGDLELEPDAEEILR